MQYITHSSIENWKISPLYSTPHGKIQAQANVMMATISFPLLFLTLLFPTLPFPKIFLSGKTTLIHGYQKLPQSNMCIFTVAFI